MFRSTAILLYGTILSTCVWLAPGNAGSYQQFPAVGDVPRLFAPDNLVAWCIVPFDARKRGPEERVAMLGKLGFTKYAYDWRDEHLSTFDQEVQLLAKNGIQLTAVWFPANLGKQAQTILRVLRKHKIRTQLWVTLGDPAAGKPDADKISAAVKVLEPIAQAAAELGCRVELYNHGGWFGQPENQLAIVQTLKRPNVGIVYNLHHGHEHLDRLPTLLAKMLPHLDALNLNGMTRNGDRLGKKILPLGSGEQDLYLLRAIRDSGYQGPIGILGHTMDDAHDRLLDNLDGLRWLLPQMDGAAPGPKPKSRTPTGASATANAPAGTGYLAAGKDEYRQQPLTVDCRVQVRSKENFQILVASDTKQSGQHWEIFAFAENGTLTVYVPGMQPDHVRTSAVLADGAAHHVGMHYEAERIRLYLDGRQVADQAVKSLGRAALAGGFAFGRLVEGGIGCDGILDHVRIRRGVQPIDTAPPTVDASTVGLWTFGGTESREIADRSRLQNPARLAAIAPPGQGPVPPDGVNYQPADPRLKAVLLDRSIDDAYLAVKLDTQGRIFVGARDAVFVFDPDGQNRYGLRQEVCRLPKDSIIMGLEWRGNDLYVLTNNALYRLPEGRVRRDGVQPQRLLWGLPLDLHVSFHCLAWGPEGDLYLNHGDPLLNHGDFDRPDHWGCWTLFSKNTFSDRSDAWVRNAFTGTGAVLRIRPDGTGLKVVAGGLRGPVGLAFDRQWNLYTNDNDHESRADLYAPARLLHVTPHADFSWPRGWMPSRTPERADLLEPMTSELGRGVPCDIAYYDEPYLPGEYRNSLLMDRWDRMAVYHYPLVPRGASMSTKELPFVTGRNNARPVGIAVGRGGRVFATALYLTGNVWSPYCYSDLFMITKADDTPEMPFEAFDPVTASPEMLWSGLSHQSWERRYRAHQEILRRSTKIVDGRRELVDESFDRLAKSKPGDPVRVNLQWLINRLWYFNDIIIEMLKDPGPEIRLQLVRILSRAGSESTERQREVLVAALDDPEATVQLAALQFFFDEAYIFALPRAVLRLASASDTYLRQTACTLLARRWDAGVMRQLFISDDRRLRLAGVLAAGIRLTVPPSAARPPEGLTLSYAAGNAKFALTFADVPAPEDLKALGQVGSYTTAQWWRTRKPTSDQKKLFDLLVGALDDPAAEVRLQAAHYLGLLRDPKIEPHLERTRLAVREQELGDRPLQRVAKAWRAGPFADGGEPADRPHPPEQGPIDLAANYATSGGPVRWQAIDLAEADPIRRGGGLARSSWYLYFRLQSHVRQHALLALETKARARVWHNGKLIVDNRSPDGKPRSVALDVQPGGNEILMRVLAEGEQAMPVVRYRSRQRLDPVLPEKTVPLKLAPGREAVGKEFLALDWDLEVKKGDAAKGRKLFETLSCVKCHAIALDQSVSGGPSLADARKRFTVAHMVESILLPDRQVAEQFRAAFVALKNGQTLTGLVVSEDEQALEVLLLDTTRRALSKKDIEERRTLASSPMPAGLVKKPDELRDLLAYMLSANPIPP